MTEEYEPESATKERRREGKRYPPGGIGGEARRSEEPDWAVPYRASLAGSTTLQGWGNVSARAGAMLQMQRTLGNRAVQRAVQRSASVQREEAPPSGGETVGDGLLRQYRAKYGVTGDTLPKAPAATIGPAPAPAEARSGGGSEMLGDVNNAVSAGTTGVLTAADASLRGLQQFLNPAIKQSPVAKAMMKVPGSGTLATLAEKFPGPKSALGRILPRANTATSALGVGLGAYNIATAKNPYDRAQAIGDTAASAAGFFGPVGRAFSGGYSAGQLLDKASGWIGEKISGKKQADKDYSLSGMAAESLMMPGRAEQQARKAKMLAEAAVRDAERGKKDEQRRKNLADPSKREAELKLIREELEAGKW